ncbi:hypothetical protein [Bordetella sp. LUAb4]|uniref:hypothetical protein n=1 Tax=Bordetella sp. LUAb4 TaxID=2843195 RepID=UPI001E56216F|nr:hypothetical protein [Bordetella sp. LUAb4]
MVLPSPNSSPHEQGWLAGLNLLLATTTLGAERQSPREIARSQLLGVQHELIEALSSNEQWLMSQLRACDWQLRQTQAALAESTAVVAEQESSLRGYRNWNQSLCLAKQRMENELTELRARSSSAAATSPPPQRARSSSPADDPLPMVFSPLEERRPILSSPVDEESR